MVERVEEEARQRIKQEQERYQKLETTFTDIDQKWQITQQTNNELSAKVNNTVQANISLNVELQGAREQSRQEKELLNEIKKKELKMNWKPRLEKLAILKQNFQN